jgi:hypothetical protein
VEPHLVGAGGRVALVHRGDRRAREAGVVAKPTLAPVAIALTQAGLTAEPAVYDDEWADEVREQLLNVQAALVWVDPVSGDQDRARLDTILREIASAGVLVSAHPDTILKIGTKDVLYDTRELGWGSDTHRYASRAELESGLPHRLPGGPRVLKQYRGNGGIGVWKVELRDATGTTPSLDTPVLVQSARTRDENVDEMPLRRFLAGLDKYFAFNGGQGRLIDQPFAPRIVDGIIRCYLVGGDVVGFSRQYPAGVSPGDLTPGGPTQSSARRVFGLPSAKTMYGPDEPSLSTLRQKVEQEWVADMQRLLAVEPDALPALWDADFLLGPPDSAGHDTYLLGEINASSVSPFPPDAIPRLADWTRRHIGGSPR